MSGAVGVEMISGKVLDFALETSVIYSLCVACEEFLEMTGIAIFIYSLLSYLKLRSFNVNLSID